MRSAKIQIVQLFRLDYFMDTRRSWISVHIDDVDAIAEQTGKNQFVSLLGRIVEAATARIPATVMQFVVGVRHFSAMNNLPQWKKK